MTKTMESLLARSSKMRDIRSKVKDLAEKRPCWKNTLPSLCFKYRFLAKHWSCIDPPIVPWSLTDEMQAIQENMDQHYDNIATSLARYRSTSNPSDKFLASNDALNFIRGYQQQPPIPRLEQPRLLKEIQEKLELAEILHLGYKKGFGSQITAVGLVKDCSVWLRGSKATRAETHAQH